MTYAPAAGEAGLFGAPTRPRLEGPLAQAIRRLRAALAPAPVEPAEPDLIDHPAFRGMSARELADLPFPRHRLVDVHGLGPFAR